MLQEKFETAIFYLDNKSINECLKSGANPSSHTSFGSTPLNLLFFLHKDSDVIESVEILINYGVDLKRACALAIKYEQNLKYYIVRQSPYQNLLEYLLKKGAPITSETIQMIYRFNRKYLSLIFKYSPPFLSEDEIKIFSQRYNNYEESKEKISQKFRDYNYLVANYSKITNIQLESKLLLHLNKNFRHFILNKYPSWYLISQKDIFTLSIKEMDEIMINYYSIFREIFFDFSNFINK